ncbi:hypothetical protein ACS0TY_034825 [Phlomoides rotata]
MTKKREEDLTGGSLTAVFVDREFDHRVRRSEIKLIIMASKLNCSRTQPPVTPSIPESLLGHMLNLGSSHYHVYLFFVNVLIIY